MNKPLSDLTSFTYRHITKPILFRMQPDGVHRRMIQSTSSLQRSRPILDLIHSTLAYDNPTRLGQLLRGVWLSNPVGLSAGFDKNFELPPMMQAVGFGFMEGGSVTYAPCAGNPRPWFYRLPKSKSLVVHAGLANQGVEATTARIQAYSAELLQTFPLNISVAQTNSKSIKNEQTAIDDYVGSLRHIQRAGVGQLLTINISCPNTYAGEPFTSPRMLERLLDEVDSLKLAQPVFIKMPNHLEWREFERLLQVAAKHTISGVTVSNLAKRETGVKLAEPLPDSMRGGLSGKPTWERSNDLIRRTYQAYGERFTIIGVGGIFSAEDAYTKIRLGASVVELITGMVFEGPALIGRINRGLVDLLDRDGFDNIRQAVGADAG